MQRLLILLIVVFSSCSSVKQLSLLGEWKPVKVTVYNAFSNKTSVLYDKNNLTSIKEKLLKQYISEWLINSKNLQKDTATFNSEPDKEFSKPDTIDFKNKLDISFAKFDSAKLIFKKDSNIYIKSYGLIIPTAVPGWHFDDNVGGKWTQHLNKLKFTIGEIKMSYPFFYKITKQTNHGLILAMTSESYKETFMTLEFNR